MRETKQILPNRWLFDLFPISARIQIPSILAAIGGQRVGTFEDTVLNHTYPDEESFPELLKSLAFLGYLGLASAPIEVADAYHNIPSHIPYCARG